MRNKRKWEARKLIFNAIEITCSTPAYDDQVVVVRHVVSPEYRRRIDYDPWRVILHLSRMMDALEGVE